MTVNLNWADLHSPPAPGVTPPHRYATYTTLHEALEQAVADDALTAVSVTDTDTGALVADKARIDAYAKAKADLEAKLAATVEKANAAHLDALAGAAG